MKEYDHITQELQTIADAFALGPVHRWFVRGHMDEEWYEVETPNGFFALWPSDGEPEDFDHVQRRLILGDHYANTSFKRQDGTSRPFDVPGNSSPVTRPDGQAVVKHDLRSRQHPTGTYFIAYRLG